MESVKFEELGLYPQLLRAIKEMGFEEATPIQAQAIPVVMSGVDVIGQAQTGTGKTASFGIPLLMKVDPNNKKTRFFLSYVRYGRDCVASLTFYRQTQKFSFHPVTRKAKIRRFFRSARRPP